MTATLSPRRTPRLARPARNRSTSEPNSRYVVHCQPPSPARAEEGTIRVSLHRRRHQRDEIGKLRLEGLDVIHGDTLPRASRWAPTCPGCATLRLCAGGPTRKRFDARSPTFFPCPFLPRLPWPPLLLSRATHAASARRQKVASRFDVAPETLGPHGTDEDRVRSVACYRQAVGTDDERRWNLPAPPSSFPVAATTRSSCRDCSPSTPSPTSRRRSSPFPRRRPRATFRCRRASSARRDRCSGTRPVRGRRGPR